MSWASGGGRVLALGSQHEWVDIGADYSVMGIRWGAGFGIRESTWAGR